MTSVCLLELPSFTVDKIVHSKNGLDTALFVSTGYRPVYCPHCDDLYGKRHKHGERLQRFFDQPLRGKRVKLWVDRQRFKCSVCGGTFEEPLEEIHHTYRMTHRLVDWVIQEAPYNTFTELARITGATESTMSRLYYDHITAKRGKDPFVTPRVLGMDEIYLDRVRGVFVDIERNTLLDFTRSNKPPHVKAFLASLDRKKVEYVTMDMCGAYRAAVQAILPRAKIVADRWHVECGAQRALDDFRGVLKEKLTPKERAILKKDRTILSSHKYNLKEYDLERMDMWFDRFPELALAHKAKEDYAKIWQHHDKADAIDAYWQWATDLPKSVEPYFRSLNKSMEAWHDEIFRYFEERLTNAKTEAMNRQIRELYNDSRTLSFEVFREKLLSSLGLQKRRSHTPKYDNDAFSFCRMTTFSDTTVYTSYGVDISKLLSLTADDFYRQ